MSGISPRRPNLVERAAKRASEPALIQNGSSPDVFSSKTMTSGLVERAEQRKAEPALIQNGSTPTEFSSKVLRP